MGYSSSGSFYSHSCEFGYDFEAVGNRVKRYLDPIVESNDLLVLDVLLGEEFDYGSKQ
jgi:hypothetical protein